MPSRFNTVVKGIFSPAFVLLALWGAAPVFAETTFCPIYPIGISSDVLADASEGDAFNQVSTAVGQGNFSWMTWSGSLSSPTLANSLLPPGDSNTYINPFDSSDSMPEIGEWVQGSPGVTGSRMVKQNLNSLLGQDIVVPVWSETQDSGGNLIYQVENFVVITLSAYQLDGQGWLSFEYKGDARCYNDPPVITDLEFTTPEDTPLAIKLSHLDPEDDPVEYVLLTPPQNGTLSGDYPNLVYTPSSNFYGDDNFVYLVNDGQFDSNTATVVIHVLPVNDAPMAFGQQYVIEEDQVLDIALVAQDVDGGALTYLIVEQPANGVLVQNGGAVTYTPNDNFYGDDSFTFKVNDGELDSNLAVITITANPVNDAPVALPARYEVFNDQTLELVLSGLDVDGDPLAYVIVLDPDSGVLEGSAPNLTYRPSLGFEGEATFEFVVNDGQLGSLPALVTIDVKDANKAPTIVTPAVVSSVLGEEYHYDVDATDPNIDDVLTYSLITQPDGMTIDASTGLVQWQPSNAYVSGLTGPNTFCSVPIVRDAAGAADIVVAIDHSESMGGKRSG